MTRNHTALFLLIAMTLPIVLLAGSAVRLRTIYTIKSIRSHKRGSEGYPVTVFELTRSLCPVRIPSTTKRCTKPKPKDWS